MLGISLLASAPADAGVPSTKKGIWGPVRIAGKSQFPLYRRLGTGLYSTRMPWYSVARKRPRHATDPADPAYTWPAELDDALHEAKRYGIRVAVEVQGSPPWANGGRPRNWVPTHVRDYANFMRAAARRYPGVGYWVIWAEPSRQPNFMPLVEQSGPAIPLNRAQRRAPRYYARLLDRTYGSIKSVAPRAKVVGGNTFSGGNISAFNWIRSMRMPNGRPPRMDLFGHHPFTARPPEMRRGMIERGNADFSDLDRVAGWVDRYIGPDPRGRPVKLYLGEFFLPTDHQNSEFGFYVSHEVQAAWLREALQIVRGWNRIETLVWLSLRDDPPVPAGDEVNRGLMTFGGRPKKSFYAYEHG